MQRHRKDALADARRQQPPHRHADYLWLHRELLGPPGRRRFDGHGWRFLCRQLVRREAKILRRGCQTPGQNRCLLQRCDAGCDDATPSASRGPSAEVSGRAWVLFDVVERLVGEERESAVQVNGTQLDLEVNSVIMIVFTAVNLAADVCVVLCTWQSSKSKLLEEEASNMNLFGALAHLGADMVRGLAVLLAGILAQVGSPTKYPQRPSPTKYPQRPSPTINVQAMPPQPVPVGVTSQGTFRPQVNAVARFVEASRSRPVYTDFRAPLSPGKIFRQAPGVPFQAAAPDFPDGKHQRRIGFGRTRIDRFYAFTPRRNRQSREWIQLPECGQGIGVQMRKPLQRRLGPRT
ncbi:unnamed protein product [Effrenium voratum]|nr:unnamed protein product [Effrenium voratum]